jgi:hypothetical protein
MAPVVYYPYTPKGGEIMADGQKSRVLADDLYVDRNDLPTEWEKQPQLYMYWAEEYAWAVMDRDKAKDQLDLVAADLDSAIRTDPAAYELVKVTEASVAAAVKKQQSYGDAVEKLHQANLVVNRMAAARSAMDHKRKALEHLTTLAVNEFYSSNTAPASSQVTRGKKAQEKFTEQQASKRGLIE